jgi:hypothetical protein
LGAVLLAALVAACASPLSGDYAKGKGKTLAITRHVWGGYQEYLTAIAGTNPGYFVVAVVDGVGVGGNYRYCPGTSCITIGSAASELVNQCKGNGPEVECILFAHSSEILVDYKIVDE